MQDLYAFILSQYRDAAILGGRYCVRSITSRSHANFCIEMAPWGSVKPTLTLNVLVHQFPVRYGLSIRSERAWHGLRPDCSKQAFLAFLDTGNIDMIYPDGYPNAAELRQRLSDTLSMATDSLASKWASSRPLADRTE
ncbi:hypothetical protein [Spirosoma luteolum]